MESQGLFLGLQTEDNLFLPQHAELCDPQALGKSLNIHLTRSGERTDGDPPDPEAELWGKLRDPPDSGGDPPNQG